MIDDMTENMKERAWRWFRSQIHIVESVEEAKSIVESSNGVVELSWCGEKECGVKLETKIDARVLGWPMEPEKDVSNICPICRKEGKYIVRVARAY
jgi:prolyl-tRNA synthetase